MAPQPDYSRAALARFIEFVVVKGLVHPATAQGWRVATTKVLEELSPEETADVRRIEVERTFKDFLNRYPGRLSPASVGEYRRRVGRAIEEFTRWMEDPGSYAFRPAARLQGRSRKATRSRIAGESAGGAAVGGVTGSGVPDGGAPESGGAGLVTAPAATTGPGTTGGSASLPSPAGQIGPRAGTTFEYPLRPDLLAQVMVPRDLTVEEARRMGAFLVTLAADFRPSPAER
jgi:hypothetical protein